MKIAIAVSGGVDSLYALWHLHNAGYEVFALHARFLDKEYSLEVLEKQCKKWNIPFHIIDMRKEFSQKVVKPFIEAHANILTPNPCSICNREIKFGLLFEKAIELGASHLATGHYVEKIDSAHGHILKSAKDKSKDQSYFLALVPKHALDKAIFPLADKNKEDIRKILEKENIIIPIPKESQEICFVPQDKHTEFVYEEAKKFAIYLKDGGRVELALNSKDTKEELALFEKQKHKHKGLWHYTEGQRKGLGIAWKEPLYVIERKKEENILVVGTKEDLKQKECFAHSPNFFIPVEEIFKEDIFFVRTRFRQKPIQAKIFFDKGKNILHVIFLEDEALTAAGQILAIYNADEYLLAGAILI